MQNFQVEFKTNSRSSGQSCCVKLVDEVFQLSTAEKERVTVLQNTEKISPEILTPDELEKSSTDTSARRTSSGLSGYCGKLVDDLLLRISFEKTKSPSLDKRRQTPYPVDD